VLLVCPLPFPDAIIADSYRLSTALINSAHGIAASSCRARSCAARRSVRNTELKIVRKMKRFRKSFARNELGNPERMEAIWRFEGTSEKLFRKLFSLLIEAGLMDVSRAVLGKKPFYHVGRPTALHQGWNDRQIPAIEEANTIQASTRCVGS
jgi:hypothetical protein